MRISALLLCALLAPCSCSGDSARTLDPSLIQTVRRSDLVITVRERGELRAAQDTRISSQLEGRATLIYLIGEGTVVSKGEKLAELDVSGIVEKRAQQAIQVAKAEAALKQATKNVEIMEKDLQAAENTAVNRLAIARMRLQKFIGQPSEASVDTAPTRTGTNAEMLGRLRDVLAGDPSEEATVVVNRAGLVEKVLETFGSPDNLELEMGEMANQILQQLDEIRLVRADLNIARSLLESSRRLAEKEYITRSELEKDEINYTRQLSKGTVAWNNLLLLIKYTIPETLIGLDQEVQNAELGLYSVRGTAEARRVREEAELRSAEAEFGLATEQLEKLDQQTANGVLRAPCPGMVVYARMDWDEPVYEGLEVRERQDIVVLPDISSMVADLKIHESQIGKIATGQHATIRIDAFPNQTFDGRVTQVATLPDPSPRSQDVKMYRVRVALQGDNKDGALRPGMNGTVVVDVGTLSGVLAVPLPALDRSGDVHFLWKLGAKGPVATPVTLGANSLTHVEVLSGLVDGDRICLVRPPGHDLPAPDASGEPAAPDRGEPAGDPR